ncbi:MAG: mandelate racemase/muconate lactonizing enzyme family protein [Anaerolineae bacterium]|nr:mandelate racemase/muconate lactonizing enzyme family protein [Anaerolineae bacterium]
MAGGQSAAGEPGVRGRDLSRSLGGQREAANLRLMKIVRISVYQIDLPFVDGTYNFAKGKGMAIADSTVVRLDTDDGISGWGEVCPLGPNYLPSYAAGARAAIGALAPHLLGQDPTQIGAVNRLMDFELSGHEYAKSPLDVACYDILGQAAGLPAYALLGGRQQHRLPMYRSLSQLPPDELVALANDYREQGYRQIQIKIGNDPDGDIERIRAIVGSRRTGEIILADANTGYRKDDALRVAAATRGLDYYYEQPCERYADNLFVRRQATQPFKLDESLKAIDDLLQAGVDNACDVACIKISKMGGLTKARFARDYCAQLGIPMTVEDTWGGEIVTAALGHLAVSTPPDFLLNTTDLHNYNTVHFADNAPKNVEGHLLVADRPGLGSTPDLDVLGEPVAVYK